MNQLPRVEIDLSPMPGNRLAVLIRVHNADIEITRESATQIVLMNSTAEIYLGGLAQDVSFRVPFAEDGRDGCVNCSV